MKVKLCGFTDEQSVNAAVAAKCDFLGFVFCERSVRKVSPKKAAEISFQVPLNIGKVAVIVDPDFSLLAEIYKIFSPDFFQFHGSETPEFLQKIRDKFTHVKIIKAFRISKASDLNQIKNFMDVADFFLFDGKSAGSGMKFDWTILQNFSCEKEWFLSGGLNIGNVEEAVKLTGAKMIDVSSGIEKIRGQKSQELISEFMNKIKNYVS